jgi:hypothetical protein
MCIPAFAQNTLPTPSASPMLNAPAPAATPEPVVAPAPAPAAAPAATPAATVSVAPDTATAAALPIAQAPADPMAKMNTTLTENVAKNDANDAAMKIHMDSQQAGAKSDMEVKHAMIAQMQAMSDQIQQLSDKVTALSAKLDAPPPAKAVKAKAAKPAVRAPIKPVY